VGKVPFHAGLLAAQMRQRRCRGAWKHATVIIQENMRTRKYKKYKKYENKTKVISADLLDFYFDFEDIYI
jgi:hypothetical protein